VDVADGPLEGQREAELGAPAAKRMASPKRPAKGRTRRRSRRRLKRGLALLGIEALALLTAALVVVVTALGRVATEFAGSDPWRSLLPFAISILVLVVAGGVSLISWLRLRRALMRLLPWSPVVLALGLSVAGVWFTQQPRFRAEIGGLRRMMGGADEAERNNLAHQVYAAYRRTDLKQLLEILERGRVFEPSVREAADAFGVDPEVLIGIGAAESAFYPRDSKDGGRGVFQITAPPSAAVELVRKRLHVERLDALNQRHNAFVAAAMLRQYLGQFHNDLFLALLAYNIGPRNGGLRSIMHQYGARDLVTIQSYLQNLPRDYPIRVLSAALAYRVWQREGKLPHYEDGNNAQHIQDIGIPGLEQREQGPALVKAR